LFSGIAEEGTPAFEELCHFGDAYRGEALAALPWMAAEIAGNDGFAAMLRLVRAEGGARLYIPHDRTLFAERVGGAVGERTHRRLLDQANATGAVEVPSSWGVFLALRRTAVAAALDLGENRRTIARRFGVTERALRKHSARR
jgi:hypothetical protein